MNINYDTYIPDKKEKLKYYSISLSAVFVISYVFYDNMGFSILLSPIFAFMMKKHYIYYLNNKRKEFLKNQFVELLQSLSASISAGRQMGEALEEGLSVIRSSYSSNTPLVIELEFMVKSIKESREEEEQLLKNFAKRVKVTDVSSFVEVYAICKETGGDMEKAIVKTSQIIMEKMNIEKEMRVLSAQKKFEGKLISIMPILVIIFLRMTSPSYLEPLYCTLAGKIIMSLSVIGMGYAYYLTEKITKCTL
ncbi:MAG: hypothetical protein JJE17_11955 [Peptostreptococcaceae bacterium]|nr:hypothetical protein [Peptostreptococcaceae bacterium]